VDMNTLEVLGQSRCRLRGTASDTVPVYGTPRGNPKLERPMRKRHGTFP